MANLFLLDKKSQKTPPHEKVLGLAPADGREIEFRSNLNDKIIEVVGKKGLTHSDVARLARTSRTRVTAILNRNTHDISRDLMLRVLAGSAGKTPIQERRLMFEALTR